MRNLFDLRYFAIEGAERMVKFDLGDFLALFSELRHISFLSYLELGSA